MGVPAAHTSLVKPWAGGCDQQEQTAGILPLCWLPDGLPYGSSLGFFSLCLCSIIAYHMP